MNIALFHYCNIDIAKQPICAYLVSISGHISLTVAVVTIVQTYNQCELNL